MKRLYCYLFGHSFKKGKVKEIVHTNCLLCGEHFIYDPDLDYHFSDKELSKKIDEELIGENEEKSNNLPNLHTQ